MFTAKKGKRTQLLHNDIQVAAFKANGWEVTEAKGKPPKQDEPKQEEQKQDEPKG